MKIANAIAVGVSHLIASWFSEIAGIAGATRAPGRGTRVLRDRLALTSITMKAIHTLSTIQTCRLQSTNATAELSRRERQIFSVETCRTCDGSRPRYTV